MVTALALIGDAVVPDNEDLPRDDVDSIYVVPSPVTDLLQEILQHQTRGHEENRDLLLQGLANLTTVTEQIRATTRAIGQNLHAFYDSLHQTLDLVTENIARTTQPATNTYSNTQQQSQRDIPPSAAANSATQNNAPNNAQNISTASTSSLPQVSQVMLTHPERPPKFRADSLSYNAVYFLKDLEKYFQKAGIPNERHLEVSLDCLGGAARNWATIYKSVWRDYGDFRRAFLNAYWSEQEQAKLRHKILTDNWDNTRSMLDHFAFFVKLAHLLTNPFSEKELTTLLMRHFPVHIQSLWSLKGKETLAEAAEFLRQQEDLVTYRNERSSNPERRSRATVREQPYRHPRPGPSGTQADARARQGNGNQRRINFTRFVPSTTQSTSEQGNFARSN